MKMISNRMAAAFLAGAAMIASCDFASAQPVSAVLDYSTRIICSGDPWYDLRCGGATGDGVTDDYVALVGAFSAAITHGYPIYVPRNTFRIGTALQIIVPYQYDTIILSNGGTIQGTSSVSDPALQIFCPTSQVCPNLKISGRLYVKTSGASAGLQIGRYDASDQFSGADIQGLYVINSGTGHGCIFGNFIDSQIEANCTTTDGGGTGVILTKWTGGVGRFVASGPTLSMLVGSGQVVKNVTFESFTGRGGGTCLQIDGGINNTFISPYLDAPGCAIGVVATNSAGNTLMSPSYTSALGTSLSGITVLNDPVGNHFASIPSLTSGLPQISVGGVNGGLPLSSVTFAPVTAPAAPTSGWTFWSDSTDNKWKGKAYNGTVRTFGNP